MTKHQQRRHIPQTAVFTVTAISWLSSDKLTALLTWSHYPPDISWLSYRHEMNNLTRADYPLLTWPHSPRFITEDVSYNQFRRKKPFSSCWHFVRRKALDAFSHICELRHGARETWRPIFSDIVKAQRLSACSLNYVTKRSFNDHKISDVVF